MSYTPKTDDEIANLARRVYRNEVYVSWMMPRMEDLPIVFLLVALIDDATRKQLIADNIQFFYEAYSEALPRGINGNPCFASMSYLNREDGFRLHAAVERIAEVVG
jgi:hypothetical protein